jgi:hypothetical protein
MSHQPVVLEHNNEEALAILIGMGFNQRDAELALRKSGNDLNAATEYLTSGRIEDDAEFDLIAAAGPEPSVRAPTVFHPRIGGHDGPDHFADVTEGSISEMVDSRSKKILNAKKCKSFFYFVSSCSFDGNGIHAYSSRSCLATSKSRF